VVLELQAEGRIERMPEEDRAGFAMAGLECVAK
jgi:hypothetical protein